MNRHIFQLPLVVSCLAAWTISAAGQTPAAPLTATDGLGHSFLETMRPGLHADVASAPWDAASMLTGGEGRPEICEGRMASGPCRDAAAAAAGAVLTCPSCRIAAIAALLGGPVSGGAVAKCVLCVVATMSGVEHVVDCIAQIEAWIRERLESR